MIQNDVNYAEKNEMKDLLEKLKSRGINKNKTIDFSRDSLFLLKVLLRITDYGVVTVKDKMVSFSCILQCSENRKNCNAQFNADSLTYSCSNCRTEIDIYELCQRLAWTDLLEELQNEVWRFMYRSKYSENIKPIDSLIDTDKVSKQEEKTAANIVKVFEKTMSERGIALIPKQQQVISDILKIFIYPWKDKKPTIITAECGIGKSTLVEAYLKYMLTIDYNFSAIVVMERREDLIRFAQELDGKAYALYGFDCEDCLKGLKQYSRNNCYKCDKPRCRVMRNYKEQMKYPILLITKERLLLQMEYENNIKSLEYWCDSTGQERKRNIVIIDEKPSLAVSNSVSVEKLKEIQEEIFDLYSKATDNARLGQLLEDINILNNICSHGIFQPLRKGFSLKKEEVNNLAKVIKNDNLKTIEDIVQLISKGGYYTRSNQYIGLASSYATASYINYDKIGAEKTIILDGTGLYDVEYRNDTFNIAAIEQIRTYEKLTINTCEKISFSKTRMLLLPTLSAKELPKLRDHLQIC